MINEGFTMKNYIKKIENEIEKVPFIISNGFQIWKSLVLKLTKSNSEVDDSS